MTFNLSANFGTFLCTDIVIWYFLPLCVFDDLFWFSPIFKISKFISVASIPFLYVYDDSFRCFAKTSLKDDFKPLHNFLLTKLDLAFLFAFGVSTCQGLWLANNLLWSLGSWEILPLLSCRAGWLLYFFSCSIWFCKSSIIWSFFVLSFLHFNFWNGFLLVLTWWMNLSY